MNGPIKTFLLLLPLALSGAVNIEAIHAEKVFIWKDEKGVTHYSDRPGPDGMETEFVISSDSSDNAQESLPGDSSGDSLNDPLNESATEVSEDTFVPDPSAPETIAFCNKLKDNLNALKTKGRIRLSHEDGREEILDDAGKEQEKQRLMEMMKQYCE